MPSTPSPALRLDLQETGENLNLWGERLNASLLLVEQAITGVLVKPISGNTTLSAVNFESDEARNAALIFTAAAGLTGPATITVPAIQKIWSVENATGVALTFTAGGTPAVVQAGRKVQLTATGGDLSQMDPGAIAAAVAQPIANAAAVSALASSNSATASALSATQAATARDNAGSSASSAAGFASSASTSRDAAAASATAAQTARTGAETARTGAETARTGAEGARDTADTHRGNAANSATAAGTSAINSANSATAAQTARTGAETARTGAETARNDAQSAAGTAAEQAAANVDSALASKVTAAQAAQTAAETARNQAQTARNDAQSAAGTAAQQAAANVDSALTAKVTAANNAATLAGTNATNAGNSAAASAASASSASDSASASTGSAATAADRALAASGSATAAAGSATAAQTARAGAETARDQAVAIVSGQGGVFNTQGGTQAGEIPVFLSSTGTLIGTSGIKLTDVINNNYVVTPRNVTPAAGSTGQGLNGNSILLQVTDYLQLAGIAFKSRRFRLATDVAMTNVVVDSGALTAVGNSFTIADPAVLQTSTQYYWQASYTDANDKVSDWSNATGFVTGVKLTLDFGDPYAGGFYGALVEYGGQRYRLVVASAAGGDAGARAFKTAGGADSGTFSDFDGVANMVLLPAGGAYPAADWCRDYRGGGFSDWYLASKLELDAIYPVLKPSTASNVTTVGNNSISVPSRGSLYTTSDPPQTAVPAFRSGGTEAFSQTIYLTSTPDGALSVSTKRFSNGDIQPLSKTVSASPNRIRPIRRVPVSA